MSKAQNKGNEAIQTSNREILFRESFVFVLDLIRYTELLEENKKDSLAKQLFTTGTAFGEIVNEARFLEKEEKNICKIKKLKKSANSIKYLLQLCKYSASYPNPNNLISELDKLIEQILKIEQIIN